MKLIIKPEHFQTIHYYFFFLGMFSLTVGFMVPMSEFYAYMFMSFYIVHSAISWYISWFLYKRVNAIYIIHSHGYMLNHVVLTLLSGGAAVAFYYIFQTEFQAMMTSLITINLFVIFAGSIWYVMGLLNITKRYMEWQGGRNLQFGRKVAAKFRKKHRLSLVSGDTLRSYKFGTDAVIDRTLMVINTKVGEGEDFSDDVKNLELRFAQNKITDMGKKVQELSMGDVTESDRNLIHNYSDAITREEKNRMEYEKRFFKKFRMSSE